MMPYHDHAVLHLRAQLYAQVRAFFASRQVLEVETPILSAAGNTDPVIESFSTCFSGHVDGGPGERWLRTSPEFALKRLLAAGVGDCYELGRVFRNGELGRWHQPEFTMLEWYRVGFDHHRLIGETLDLVESMLALVGRKVRRRMESYQKLFLDGLGLDPFASDPDDLHALLASGCGIDPRGLGRDDVLDLLLTHLLQPTFPADCMTVIYDYPVSQCALAKIRPGDPPLAERFELYAGRHELANGYHELNDAIEQRMRFEHDNARRRACGLRQIPVDTRLLAVLDALPEVAGVALGMERLLLCLTGSDNISEVVTFPFAQA